MFKDRTKRVDLNDVQMETILDLLKFLPRRLLEAIVIEWNLKPVDDSKAGMILVITENRKQIFISLKFTLSYVKRKSD